MMAEAGSQQGRRWRAGLENCVIAALVIGALLWFSATGRDAESASAGAGRSV